MGRDFTSWRIWKGRVICQFDVFMAVKKSWKRWLLSAWFWDTFIFKESALAVANRDAKFSTRDVKGVPFLNRRYSKGVPFKKSTYIHKYIHQVIYSRCIKICTRFKKDILKGRLWGYIPMLKLPKITSK